jgi:hypothetical protein
MMRLTGKHASILASRRVKARLTGKPACKSAIFVAVEQNHRK